MRSGETLRLSLAEARGVALGAQRLLDPPRPEPNLDSLHGVIDHLGVVQVDTISVVERSQYLVLWSRLGAYDAALLDALLHPERRTFEYWSHAASILPMADYPYYRARMLRVGADSLWAGDRTWMNENGEVLRRTLEAVRERGPVASAEFERAGEARRSEPWDWYGNKESRRALQLLWMTGDVMVHSRRGGQKVYDLAERVLAEAFGDVVSRDEALPSAEECVAHFTRRTARALGVVTPAWLWDYFRLPLPDGAARTRRVALEVLDAGVEQGWLVRAEVEGLREPAYIARESLADLERLRGGLAPLRTTLLSPFDNLIWHRERTRALWDYEVCFEAYVLPEKRRFGYYCLAILHQGRIVGRLDPKMDRAARQLVVRAVYLEPEVLPEAGLLDGIAEALRELARFLGATSVRVERATPAKMARGLNERLAVKRRASRKVVRVRAEA